jgi:hypothetical protein
MKKSILAFVTLTLVGAGVQNARAGDCEWAVAGKVLTGVAAAAFISSALQPEPVYTSHACAPVVYPAPARVYRYVPAPVVYAPVRPVVVYRAPAPVVVRVAPPPVVTFRVAFGGGGHHRHHGRW